MEDSHSWLLQVHALIVHHFLNLNVKKTPPVHKDQQGFFTFILYSVLCILYSVLCILYSVFFLVVQQGTVVRAVDWAHDFDFCTHPITHLLRNVNIIHLNRDRQCCGDENHGDENHGERYTLPIELPRV